MDHLITIESGELTTTSLAVAKKFEKRHDNVLRAIKRLECDAEFSRLNFEEVIREFQNGKGGTQKGPTYTTTRDGFAGSRTLLSGAPPVVIDARGH
ncbi:MAG: Rha family transcriptional regulator [Burkholderiaceae bacterium]